MSEYGELREVLSDHRRQQKRSNTERRLATLPEARMVADSHGMVLERKQEGVHYQLKVLKPSGGTRWLWNLYPSTGRILSDEHRQTPFLSVPHDWTFRDVVSAAIGAIEKEGVT